MRVLRPLFSFVCSLILAQSAVGQILDDFETSNSWIPGVANEWSASTTTPISNTQSLKHGGTGTTSGSTRFSNVSRALPAVMSNLNGSTTTWEFKLKTSGRGVSASQKFWIVLAANGTNMRMPNTSNVVDISVPSANGINGYAIGVNPISSTATARPLKLMRITNSAATDLVTVNGSSYSGNYGTSTTGYNSIGIKVVRNASAAWTVSADFNNDGTYEVVTSPVTDNTHNNSSFVGASLRWPTTASPTNTLAGNLYLDNFSVTQTAVPVTYYSIASGNMSGTSVWSLTANGAAVTPVFNYASTLVISHPITIDGSYALANVTLQTGGTLTAGSGSQTLTLSGNWINNHNSAAFNGNFDPTCCTSGCRMVMGGTTAQTIGGTSGTKFMELQINNSAGVTLMAPTYVTASVLPTNGTLTTNGTGGSLALLCNSTCAGSIAAIAPTADVIGPLTLQRFVPGETRGTWLFLSCPLYSNAALTTGLSPNAAWSGTTVNGIAYPTITMTASSIIWYNETVVGSSNDGFTTIHPSTGVMNPTVGTRVYANGQALTINPSGYIMKGNITIPMTYTASGVTESFGRNLLSNPYPSEVNWDIVEAGSSNVGAYYVYDYTSNNYLYYNPNDGLFNTTPANPEGIGKYIPHSQSFFVICTGNNQFLNFTEAAKTSRCNPKLFERSNAEPALSLHLMNDQFDVVDASNISHNANCSHSFDQGWDVLDLYELEKNPFNLSLLSSENQLLMATSVSLENENSIPVYVDLHNDMGAFQYAYVKISGLGEDRRWNLLNNLSNQPLAILRNGQTVLIHPSQKSTIEKGDYIRIPFMGSYHGTAFFLQNCTDGQCLDAVQAEPSQTFSLNVLNLSHSVVINANGAVMKSINVFNSAGQKVMANTINSTTFDIHTTDLPAGIYTVRIEGEDQQTEVTRFFVK